MVLEESAVLSEQRLGVLGGAHLEDGRFAFALDESPDAPAAAENSAAGTYLLTSLAEAPVQVNDLPPVEQGRVQMRIIWAKDGSGALLRLVERRFQSRLFYAPTDGDLLYEITAVIGPNSHNFQWQPEIIVP